MASAIAASSGARSAPGHRCVLARDGLDGLGEVAPVVDQPATASAASTRMTGVIVGAEGLGLLGLIDREEPGATSRRDQVRASASTSTGPSPSRIGRAIRSTRDGSSRALAVHEGEGAERPRANRA